MQKAHLVSGGCGFVGRNMVKRLYKTTEDIIVFVDDLSVGTAPKTWFDEPVIKTVGNAQVLGEAERLIFIQSDIRDVIRNIYEDHTFFQTQYGLTIPKFHDVFHFAAIVGGRAKIDGDPHDGRTGSIYRCGVFPLGL